MLIDFNAIPETVIPKMRGGEKEVRAHMYVDNLGKIMKGKLIPGATIGMHTHETSSEVIYILSGVGKVLCEGVYEPLAPGACHYCPKGSCHEIINAGSQDLILLTIVPKQ